MGKTMKIFLLVVFLVAIGVSLVCFAYHMTGHSPSIYLGAGLVLLAVLALETRTHGLWHLFTGKDCDS